MEGIGYVKPTLNKCPVSGDGKHDWKRICPHARLCRRCGYKDVRE